MPLPQFFFINGYEIGGTKSGHLQYLSDEQTDTWTVLGDWTAQANSTTILINSEINPIEIDYNIFNPGGGYWFRLIDNEGHPISNKVFYTFPYGAFNSGFSNAFTIQQP